MGKENKNKKKKATMSLKERRAKKHAKQQQKFSQNIGEQPVVDKWS